LVDTRHEKGTKGWWRGPAVGWEVVSSRRFVVSGGNVYAEDEVRGPSDKSGEWLRQARKTREGQFAG